ncbi:MAG: transposase [Deltaproteobacteria bacterium]|nr:transposase [Deltaproteobacteria bacterium]
MSTCNLGCKYHIVWCPKYRFGVMKGQCKSK